MAMIHLFQFLSKVSAHSATNLMDNANLGTVFGPNLMWKDNDPVNIGNYAKSAELISFMIENILEFQMHLKPAFSYMTDQASFALPKAVTKGRSRAFSEAVKPSPNQKYNWKKSGKDFNTSRQSILDQQRTKI